MCIYTKYEERVKYYLKRQNLACSFFSAESDSFGIFQNIPNLKTFQIECLWNFLLVVIKVTKQSCCHGNCISKIISHMGKEQISMSFITLKTVLK